jgi:poly(A) polymerase
MIKLLQTGHALSSIEELRKQGLHQGVFPVLDVVLDEAHRHDGREKFVQLALADTDRRVGEGKPVAPSFMLACMLWHEVLKRWDQLQATGESAFGALQTAVDEVFDARIGDISGRGKLAADMREIWLMQPRFDRRQGQAPFTLIEQPRFRAGFDFLRLRADAGEIDPALATWWEQFSVASLDERQQMVESLRPATTARKTAGRRRASGAKSDATAQTGEPRQAVLPLDDPNPSLAEEAAWDAAVSARPARPPRPPRSPPLPRAAAELDLDLSVSGAAEGAGGDEGAAGAGDGPPAAKKRRRRRRKPAGDAGASGEGGSAADNAEGGARVADAKADRGA